MGDIYRRVVTEFRTTGGQQILATLGELRGGVKGIREEFTEGGIAGSAFNNEMRALGTTLRYAFAGSVVFGVSNMVRNLSQIQTQLGQIAAIGSQAGPGGGSIPLTGSQISGLAETVRQAATDTITPVNQMNDAVLNLYSTIQNVPPNRAVEMVKEFAKTAILTQTDVTTLQQVALQSQFAFHRPHTVAEARRQAQEYFTLISAAPGGPAAAGQIFQQLGPLARVFAFGHGTQEQMLGFTLAALRGGGTPATNLRGLQYLVQTVASPDEQQKTSRSAFHRLGITDEFVRKYGVAKALERVLGAIRSGGVSGGANLRNLDDDTLAQVEAQAAGDPFAATSQLGIGGTGATLAAQLFHRVHALRTAVGLATQTQRGPGVDATVADDLQRIADAANGHAKDVDDLQKAWTRFRQQSRLPQAAQAIQTMTLDVATELESVINYRGKLTGGITDLSKQVHAHPDISIAALLGIGALALRGGRAGLLAGGARGALGGSVVAQGVLSGQNVPGGSPLNPLFVWVVGQGFNPFGGRVMFPKKIGPEEEPPPGSGGISGFFRRQAGNIGAGGLALASRFGGAARQVGGAGRSGLLLFGAEAPALGDMLSIAQGKDPFAYEVKGNYPLLRFFQEHRKYGSPAERDVIRRFNTSTDPQFGFNEAASAKRLREIAHTYPRQWADLVRQGVVVMTGHAKIDINVNEKDASGKTTRTTKKKVTVDLFPDFTTQAPNTRRGNTRRGGR